jgi:hypothetical protein
MNWNTAARKLGIWLRPTDRSTVAARDDLTFHVEMPSHDTAPAAGPRIRKLRRRLLSRKGARMLVSMVENEDKGMLAILDVHGVVVYWHDGALAEAQSTDDVLDRHVAQFYAPKKLSQVVANDHLCKAFTRGGGSELGWRRRADGSVFWGVTVIEPLLLADGRLQGFTHITRIVNEPREPAVEARTQSKGRWRNIRVLRSVGTIANTAASAQVRSLGRRRIEQRAAFA